MSQAYRLPPLPPQAFAAHRGRLAGEARPGPQGSQVCRPRPAPQPNRANRFRAGRGRDLDRFPRPAGRGAGGSGAFACFEDVADSDAFEARIDRPEDEPAT